MERTDGSRGDACGADETPTIPRGLVDYIVDAAAPGAIILAHDVGEQDRLVALRSLPQMITGLRRRGFTLVTASDLIAQA
jgi:peptidoglycan-N-acetylglucosamine deacetylase